MRRGEYLGGGGVLKLVEESDHLVRRRLTRDGREPGAQRHNIYYPQEVRRGEYWGWGGVLKLVEESDHLVRRRLTRDGREPAGEKDDIYYLPLLYFTRCICPGYPGRSSGGGGGGGCTSYAVFIYSIYSFSLFYFIFPFFLYCHSFITWLILISFFCCFLHIVLVCVK